MDHPKPAGLSGDPLFSHVPKRSMYENQPNVGKCTIHGFWKEGNIQFEHGSQ